MTLIKTFISADNIQNICRVCLEEKPSCTNIDSIVDFQDIDVAAIAIVDILQKVAKSGIFHDIEINLICSECINELTSAYLFTLKIEQANRIVEEFVKAEIKLEIVEELNESSDNDSDSSLSFTEPIQAQEQTPQKQPNESNSLGKLHSCPFCKQEFTALELRAHVRTHRVFRKYLNIPLNERVSAATKFSTKRHLDETQQCLTIFAQTEKMHRCAYCNEKYRAEELKLHMEVHRNVGQHKCDKCPRVFRFAKNLKIHRLKHMKEFPFTCEHCQKGFVVKTNYDCHILIHKNEELPHECKDCFRRFSNPKHLSRHQIIHTEHISYGSKYKLFKCNHCRQTVKDQDELKTHVCVPVKYKYYKCKNRKKPTCKLCNAVFCDYNTLNRHKRFIHNIIPNTLPEGLCSVCGVYVTNLPGHMKSHTAVKRFKCDQCDKKFLFKPMLSRHLLIHSGEKPFICSKCGKAFNNRSNLKVHERIHNGNRCHICEFCGKGFLEKTYLKKHLLVHEKLECV